MSNILTLRQSWLHLCFNMIFPPPHTHTHTHTFMINVATCFLFILFYACMFTFWLFLLLKTENQMIVPALKSLAWVIFTISMISVTLLRADSWVGWPNNNYCFHSIFSFNKKESLSCQFATYQRNALFEFLTSQTGQMAFSVFKVIIR